MTESTTITDLVKRAESQYRKEKYADALLIYTQIIELELNNTEVWYKRAITKYMLGNIAGTIQDLSAVLSIDPKHVPARLKRAEFAQQLYEDDLTSVRDKPHSHLPLTPYPSPTQAGRGEINHVLAGSPPRIRGGVGGGVRKTLSLTHVDLEILLVEFPAYCQPFFRKGWTFTMLPTAMKHFAQQILDVYEQRAMQAEKEGRILEAIEYWQAYHDCGGLMDWGSDDVLDYIKWLKTKVSKE